MSIAANCAPEPRRIPAFAAQLQGSGMSEAFVRGYVEMMQAKDQGLDNAEPRTAENTTPTSG